MASPKRLQRVASVLREEIGKILSREVLGGNGILVTVTSVGVSPDLLHAAVRISTYPSERAGECLTDLEKNVWRIQQLLNARLRMRPVPKIRFVLDRSEEEAAKIEKTLKEVEK